jgi:hypothetical protein
MYMVSEGYPSRDIYTGRKVYEIRCILRPVTNYLPLVIQYIVSNAEITNDSNYGLSRA